MVLPPVVARAWASFKKWCKKYESVISVATSLLPVIGQFVAKTIVKRTLAGLMGLSALGIVGILNQEDVKTTAYLDGAGVPTIGAGSTKGVKMGDTITVRQAINRAAKEIHTEYEVGFHKCVGDVPLYQNEYDTYMRATYNIGVSAFCTSTMVKRLREGDYAGACRAIKMFNKITVNGKKVVSRGLANLREEQYAQCMVDPNG